MWRYIIIGAGSLAASVLLFFIGKRVISLQKEKKTARAIELDEIKSRVRDLEKNHHPSLDVDLSTV